MIIIIILNNVFTSENINPFYISFHINNDLNDYRMINHLKKYQPIGCRDKKTYNKLLKKGIKAYFSGCITTTLDIHYYQKENSRGKEIYLNYIGRGIAQEIPYLLKI